MASRRQVLEGILLALPTGLVGRAFAQSGLLSEKAVEMQQKTNLRDWHLYESCGQRMFPIFDKTGGLATKEICWLIRYFGPEPISAGHGKYWEAIPVVFTDLEQMAVNYDEQALKRLVFKKFTDAVKFAKPEKVDLDGGVLPMPNETTP